MQATGHKLGRVNVPFLGRLLWWWEEEGCVIRSVYTWQTGGLRLSQKGGIVSDFGRTDYMKWGQWNLHGFTAGFWSSDFVVISTEPLSDTWEPSLHVGKEKSWHEMVNAGMPCSRKTCLRGMCWKNYSRMVYSHKKWSGCHSGQGFCVGAAGYVVASACARSH